MSIENLKTFGKFATFPLPARSGISPFSYIPTPLYTLDATWRCICSRAECEMWIPTLPHLVSPSLTAAG